MLWEDGPVTDLNDLLPSDSAWALQNATAIDDADQIGGQDALRGQARGLLVTLCGN